jgi:hypothetical protein
MSSYMVQTLVLLYFSLCNFKWTEACVYIQQDDMHLRKHCKNSGYFEEDAVF